MNSDDIRALQAPLKQKYREHPEAALITLKARSRIGDGISCKIETGKAMLEAGLHPATGGDGLAACSGDMLLEALAACSGVTLRAVASAIDVDLRDATINVEGDLDFRGTLGVAKEAPVGFRQIRINLELDCDADTEQLDSLMKLTERYCVVYQTLSQTPAISINHQVKDYG